MNNPFIYLPVDVEENDVSPELLAKISSLREQRLKDYMLAVNELRDLTDAVPSEPVKAPAPVTGKNHPCPCGSGKKYKVCCMAKTPEPISHFFLPRAGSGDRLQFTQDFEAANGGDQAAQFRLYNHYWEGKTVKRNVKEALRWLELSADAGYGEAAHQLGVIHKNGAGVPKDYGKAVHWLSKAAGQGNSLSQSILGVQS
ncbi:tetratricopeptide repeat protein [Brevibacillus fluminis]|nr:tetratricopeptide repeat protein [Brevibacillus fluminis]